MFENEQEIKKPLNNKMHIAFLHPNPSQNDLTKKILEKVTPEFKDRLIFTNYTNYKDIYKDLSKLTFSQDTKSYKRGLINQNIINELYERRPALIIYFHFVPNGANKSSEEKKLYENISEMKKYDELVYIMLFIISKESSNPPFSFNSEEDRPYNLRKLILKELIFEFSDEVIWRIMDINNIYNSVMHYTRLYYRVYKIKIKDKKIKSTSREEKIECNIMLGILSILKSKKLIYTKNKYLEEAYDLITDDKFNKAQYLYGDKSLGIKFNLSEIRSAADWLFYKRMSLLKKNQNETGTKSLGHSLTDLMGKGTKNSNKNIVEENEIIDKYVFHIKSFSFIDTIIKGNKDDNFILVEYYWLIQRYKDLNDLMEENVKLNNYSRKKFITYLNIHLKLIYYFIKLMKFFTKKKLDNPNIISINNKEMNISRIDTEQNYFYGKPPMYSYKDVNNPLSKNELGFNEDIFIKKFVIEKKINFDGPLNEMYKTYLNKLPKLLMYMRSNIRKTNFSGEIDLYINILRIALLINKVEKEDKYIFGNVENIKFNNDICSILNDTEFLNLNILKKFPKVYLHYLDINIKSLIHLLNTPDITNISKTKLFIDLSLLGNIRKLNDEEENIYFQLINDENFKPETPSQKSNSNSNLIIIKLNPDNINNKNIKTNSLFDFEYKLKETNDNNNTQIQEKKILDLVQYDFQLRTYLSKEKIKLNMMKVYILCINEDEFNKDKKKEILMKQYTKEELSNFDLSFDSPINLSHKIFMKYKKGKIYLTQVEFSLQKKENIIYKIDLPINLNKMIFITNLNKKVLNIKIPKEKLTVGLNQYNKFEIEVNKEEFNEVQISQFKMNFMSIPSYYKKAVPSTSMKALLNKGTYSSKITEQIFGLPKNEKKQENMFGFLPPEKHLSQSTKSIPNPQSSMHNFLYKNPNENKTSVNNNTTLLNNKTPLFPNNQKTPQGNVMQPQQNSNSNINIQNDIIQVAMPSPIFYYYNPEKNCLDNIEKNYEKEYNDFDTLIKNGKTKFGVLMKFSLTGQYEIKLNISYSIRHRDIEDYIWFTQEETLKFIVIEPFKLCTEISSANLIQRSKITGAKKEEKFSEFFTDQKVQMNIILTNQLNEDIIIKDILIQLNQEQLGSKNKDILLKCPTKDIIDSSNLPLEVKNQILKIIKMADYSIPFETNFIDEFKGSVGKFILKWTTPSLLNYENSNLEIINENSIDFPEVSITTQRLKFDYNTFTNENNEIILSINLMNKTNDSVKIQFIIENGQEVNFIVSGVTKQVHHIQANEIVNIIFRLIPLLRNQELKLPVVKICEMNLDTQEKISSNYYFLDKIYIT